MNPIDFEGSNITLHKPSDMTDEQCGPLKAYKGVHNDNFPYYVTMWQPSDKDKEAIAAGRPIVVKVVGTAFPPIAVMTTDENNEVNP